MVNSHTHVYFFFSFSSLHQGVDALTGDVYATLVADVPLSTVLRFRLNSKPTARLSTTFNITQHILEATFAEVQQPIQKHLKKKLSSRRRILSIRRRSRGKCGKSKFKCLTCAVTVAKCAGACAASFPAGCVACAREYSSCCKCLSHAFGFSCKACV